MKSMIRFIPVLMLLSSCSEAGTRQTKHVLHIAEKPLLPPLRQQVIAAPKILVCYVPSHTAIGDNILVGDHFVFIKIRESNWIFNRDEVEKDPFENLQPEERDTSRALTPFRADTVVPYWDEKPKENAADE